MRGPLDVAGVVSSSALSGRSMHLITSVVGEQRQPNGGLEGCVATICIMDAILLNSKQLISRRSRVGGDAVSGVTTLRCPYPDRYSFCGPLPRATLHWIEIPQVCSINALPKDQYRVERRYIAVQG